MCEFHLGPCMPPGPFSMPMSHNTTPSLSSLSQYTSTGASKRSPATLILELSIVLPSDIEGLGGLCNEEQRTPHDQA